MLTVACVLSPGPTYNQSHVARLRMMVAQHLNQSYRFVCLDDSPFTGWWAKASLFEPGRFEGRVLYLDLDVTVTGNLDDLADFPAPFALIKDWNRIGFNSSIMAWDAGTVDSLFTEFDNSVTERFRGDQDWIWAKRHDAATFPKDWCVSFRKQMYIGVPFPDDMRVLVFHGAFKPWDLAAYA